ncbi:MAG: helix-turn-helix domain-containing protein, partial [bacterium]|nr:helix-turn-helix domain-containing protein [bacterium]
AANWQALTAKMAKKRGVEPVKVEAGAEMKTVKEIKVRPVKEAIKEVAEEEMPPEAEVKVMPVEEAIEEVAEEEMPPEMSLEERVLEFINRHPKGVSVGDMEETLGVVRMRLGVIAKKLLNEGKVKKEENIYFPL